MCASSFKTIFNFVLVFRRLKSLIRTEIHLLVTNATLSILYKATENLRIQNSTNKIIICTLISSVVLTKLQVIHISNLMYATIHERNLQRSIY